MVPWFSPRLVPFGWGKIKRGKGRLIGRGTNWNRGRGRPWNPGTPAFSGGGKPRPRKKKIGFFQGSFLNWPFFPLAPGGKGLPKKTGPPIPWPTPRRGLLGLELEFSPLPWLGLEFQFQLEFLPILIPLPVLEPRPLLGKTPEFQGVFPRGSFFFRG